MPPPIIVKDGKRYYDVPGSSRLFPVDDIAGPDPAMANPPRLSDGEPGGVERAQARGFKQGMAEAPMTQFLKHSAPEIGAGLTAAMMPATGGLSLAAPPLVAGATNAAQQYMDKGSVDIPEVLTRTGLNLIPGAIGRGVGKFLPGSGTLTRALEGAATGDGWTANIARGLKGALGSQASPAVTIAQAGGKANAPTSALIAQLEQKLQDPSLNTTAKAAVLTALKKLQGGQSMQISQGLRTVLGLGEGTALHEGGR